MAMATRLGTPEYVSVMRPSRLVNSLLVSSTNAAAKMLVAVASSSTVATREGERWKAMDHLRYLTMITLWVTIWMLRVLTDYFPTFGVLPSSRDNAPQGLVLAEASGRSSPAQAGALVLPGGFGNSGAGTSTRAVGRALCHVLSLLSDIPATSRKYDFVLNAAERILDENASDGEASLREVNRHALSSAFSFTCDRLRRSLQVSYESDQAYATWPSRVLHLLPLGPVLASYCHVFLGLLSAGEAWRGQRQRRLLPSGPGGEASGRRHECLESEKLAQELLWMTKKMRESAALDEAVLRWSFATGLASLSLTAHPRVQAPVVRISVLLLRELARGEGAGAPREVRFKILALWLPLLCYAGNGTSCPVLTGPEKRDMEGVLEELIQELPWEDQELILANWMEDFAMSMSDWPNLQSCYDQWCRSSRKLLL